MDTLDFAMALDSTGLTLNIIGTFIELPILFKLVNKGRTWHGRAEEKVKNAISEHENK